MDKKTHEILEKLYGEASRKYNIPLEYFTLPEEYLFQPDEWREIQKKRNRYVNNLSAISPDYYTLPKFGHRSFVDDSD
jgi:hypothetical protein